MARASSRVASNRVDSFIGGHSAEKPVDVIDPSQRRFDCAVDERNARQRINPIGFADRQLS